MEKEIKTPEDENEFLKQEIKKRITELVARAKKNLEKKKFLDILFGK